MEWPDITPSAESELTLIFETSYACVISGNVIWSEIDENIYSVSTSYVNHYLF